jgi:hypothetical protein
MKLLQRTGILICSLRNFLTIHFRFLVFIQRKPQYPLSPKIYLFNSNSSSQFRNHSSSSCLVQTEVLYLIWKFISVQKFLIPQLFFAILKGSWDIQSQTFNPKEGNVFYMVKFLTVTASLIVL